MSLTKRIGLGVKLSVDAAGGTTWVELGSIVDGIETDAKATSIDTSLLGDTYSSFLKGPIDGGSMQFTIAYSSEDSNTTQILNGLLASTSQTLANWQLTYPAVGGGSSDTEIFKGFVESVGRSIKRDGFLTAKVSVKVSGDPGLSAS